MNALGIYLFVSLIFILGSILELALIMAVQRWYELGRRTKPANGNSYKGRGSFNVTSLIERIDGMAMILSFLAYTLFNAVHWTNI